MRWTRLSLPLFCLAAAAAPARAGTYALGLAAGANVDKPFSAVRVGYQADGVAYAEPFAEWSFYNKAIGTFPFQGVLIGALTHLPAVGPVRPFFAAGVGMLFSLGGKGPVDREDFGTRILGQETLIGGGGAVPLSRELSATFEFCTGYPVYARTSGGVQWRF